MKLIQRRPRRHLSRVPRISISQDEITADLIYPARRPAPGRGAASRGKRR